MNNIVNTPMFPFTVVPWKVAGNPRAQKKTSYYNFVKSGILFLAFSFFPFLTTLHVLNFIIAREMQKNVIYFSKCLLNYFIWNFILA